MSCELADAAPASRLAPVTLSWATLCALGTRASNQDALGEAQQDDMACFVMSDGAGGHAGGEVAARLVVESVLASFLRESSFSRRALFACTDHAIAEVARARTRDAQISDMSATVAVLLIDQSNRTALWAHLGDTRIYRFRAGRIVEMSKDHSVAQQFIDAGYGHFDQLREHPQRNILFAAIGAEGESAVDVRADSVAIAQGDAFLICTDGFWEWVMEADMEDTLGAAVSSEQWLGAMNAVADARVAKANKPRDNYSAFAIWVEEPGGAP